MDTLEEIPSSRLSLPFHLLGGDEHLCSLLVAVNAAASARMLDCHLKYKRLSQEAAQQDVQRAIDSAAARRDKRGRT